MSMSKQEVCAEHRRQRREEHIAEICRSHYDIAQDGFATQVLKTVARWFRRRGFRVSHQRGEYYSVHIGR